jgi:hypothetical protein
VGFYNEYRHPRTDAVPEGLKRCTRCEIDYPIEEFHSNAGRDDGLDSWCRTCVGLRTKRYRQMTQYIERASEVSEPTTEAEPTGFRRFFASSRSETGEAVS